jgi:hypothetical protein
MNARGNLYISDTRKTRCSKSRQLANRVFLCRITADLGAAMSYHTRRQFRDARRPNESKPLVQQRQERRQLSMDVFAVDAGAGPAPNDPSRTRRIELNPGQPPPRMLMLKAMTPRLKTNAPKE